MGNVGFNALKELALALRDQYQITTFIETGTYKGTTTEWATDNFKRVISIELDEGWHKRAKETLDKRKGLKLILGDSGVELAKVLKRIKEPALIWLDAHWCKAKEAQVSECPLREELQAIRDSKINHFILIDDARLFQNPPNQDWPTLDEVQQLLPAGYKMVIYEDAIIALPVEAIKVIGRVMKPVPTVKMESRLEPIILTSNKYLHCLPPFAYLFNKFWPNQSAKVVRYEVRPPKLPDNFTNYAIGIQDDYTWSSGLLKYLEDHQDNLILLMLEDYFINMPVKVGAIKWAWDYMLKYPEIAKIDLTNDRLKVPHSKWMDTDDLILTGKDAPFQTSLQAAIWRVDFLKRFLDPTENPWQFEKNGTKRVIAAREADEFDGLILGFKNPPLSYVNAKGGEGTQPHLWDEKKIPPWMMDELSRKGLM